MSLECETVWVRIFWDAVRALITDAAAQYVEARRRPLQMCDLNNGRLLSLREIESWPTRTDDARAHPHPRRPRVHVYAMALSLQHHAVRRFESSIRLNSLHVHEESPAESPRRLAGSPGRRL